MTELSKVQRWEIAEQLDEIPTACWTDLVDWTFDGYSKAETDDGETVRNPMPDVTSGAWCATGPDLMRVGCCYCGKFRAGLQLTAALEPVDADEGETPDEYDEIGAL